MQRRYTIILGIALAIFVIGSQCLFEVGPIQKALVLQLGKPLERVYEPGLHIKLPLVQNVIYFDSRYLDYDASPAEALTADKKTIVIDNYARWRIVDPITFYKTVRTIPGAQARINDVVYSQLRVEVGVHNLSDVISNQRSQIMELVTKRSSEHMKEFGIEVVDVRIKRADLPVENQLAVFGRMRAERERQARQYRSEGTEQSTRIRSEADREKAQLLAESNRESSIIRGQADAEAAASFTQAFSQDVDFFEFQRGLETLRKSLQSNTRMVLTTDDPLLKPLQ